MSSREIPTYAYMASFSPKPKVIEEKKDCFKLVVEYKFTGGKFPMPVFRKYDPKKNYLHGVCSFEEYSPGYRCNNKYIILYSVNSRFVPEPVGFFGTHAGAFFHANNELPPKSEYYIMRITRILS